MRSSRPNAADQARGEVGRFDCGPRCFSERRTRVRFAPVSRQPGGSRQCYHGHDRRWDEGPGYPRLRRRLRLPAARDARDARAPGASCPSPLHRRDWCTYAQHRPLRLLPRRTRHQARRRLARGPAARVLRTQIHAFAAGERHNDTNAVMRNVARRLAGDEMEQAARFYANLQDFICSVGPSRSQRVS